MDVTQLDPRLKNKTLTKTYRSLNGQNVCLFQISSVWLCQKVYNFLESEWCLLLTNPGGQFQGKKHKRLSCFEKFKDGCYRSCIDNVSINLNQNNLHQLHFARLNFKSSGLFV